MRHGIAAPALTARRNATRHRRTCAHGAPQCGAGWSHCAALRRIGTRVNIRRMKKVFALPMLLLAACATMTHGPNETINVDSEPRGAAATIACDGGVRV